MTEQLTLFKIRITQILQGLMKWTYEIPKWRIMDLEIGTQVRNNMGSCSHLQRYTLRRLRMREHRILANPKGNQPWIFIGRTDAEAPRLWPPDVKSHLIGKDPDAGQDWRQKEKRVAEDEMVRECHQLNGHEFEQTLGDRGRQEILACCSSWGHKESDTT